MKRFLIVALAILLTACNTTQGLGYKNPSYSTNKLSRVAVNVTHRNLEYEPTEFGTLLENKVVQALKNRGVDARSTSELARFSASFDEFGKKIIALGVTDILTIRYENLRDSSVSSYQTNQLGGTTYTTPVRGLSINVVAKAELLSIQERNKVWEGDLQRYAYGLAFTGVNLTSDELTLALLQSLEKDKLISPAR